MLFAGEEPGYDATDLLNLDFNPLFTLSAYKHVV